MSTELERMVNEVNKPELYWNRLMQYRTEFITLKQTVIPNREAYEEQRIKLIDQGSALVTMGSDTIKFMKNSQVNSAYKRIFEAFDKSFNLLGMITDLAGVRPARKQSPLESPYHVGK